MGLIIDVIRALVDPRKCREVPRYTRIGLYLSGFVVGVVVLLGVVSPFVPYVPEDHVTPNAKFLDRVWSTSWDRFPRAVMWPFAF